MDLRVDVGEDQSRDMLWIRILDEDVSKGKIGVVTEYRVEQIDQNTPIPASAILPLSHKRARWLLNRLWTCGVRPEGYEHPDETIRAMQKHIDSLERVVEHSFEIIRKLSEFTEFSEAHG